MKEKGLRLLSILSLFIFTMISPLKVNGQEDLANFQLDLSIVLNGQAYPQSQYKYDIIERGANQEVVEGAAVYKYDPQDPDHQENIQLSPGIYTFRLYDGSETPFVREGLPISLAKSEQTNQDGTGYTDTLTPGAINDWGNGTVVYDINFQVFAGQEELDLVLIFSDGTYVEETQESLLESSSEEISQSEELDESTETSLDQETTVDPNLTETIQVPFMVTDQDGQAVEGVEVSLNQVTGLTGPDGQVEIEMEAGQANIQISQVPEGYEGVSDYDPVMIDGQVIEPIALSVLKQAPAPATGSSKIMVYDQAQHPVAGVSLLVNDQEYQSDSQGQILIEDLPAGDYPYSVMTVPEGYQAPEAGSITIQADQVLEMTLNIESIQTPGQIVISVMDQTKQPVSQAQIILNDQSFVTNDQGQAIILELVPGDYHYELGGLPEGYSGQASGQIKLEAGQEATADIQVEKELAPGQIVVSVLDQTDQPVPGATVSLGDKDQVTNENGLANFDTLAPKTYSLSLKSLPEGYSHQVQAQELVLEEAGYLEKALVVERELAARQLTIQALDQNSQPVAKATIKVGDQEITTDDQGQALIKEIKPGTYDFSVTGLPTDYLSGQSGQVTIPEAEDASLTVYFEKDIKPAKALISFYDQNQNPVAGVNFQFGGLSASSDSNGQIYFDQLSPGDYNYQVTGLPEGYTSEEIADVASLKEEDEFKLDLQVEKLPDQGQVKVVVTDDAGQPVPGATVKLSGMEIKTDKEGQAIFKPINVGEVTVELTNIPSGYELNQASQAGQVKKDQTTDLVLSVKKIQESTTTETTTETTVTTTTTTSPEPTSTTETTVTTLAETTSSPTTTEASTTSQSKPIKDLVLTPQEEKDQDAQAKEATRQFVDADTGIEVWVNPQDAGQIVRLRVDKVDASLVGNLDADVYKLTLIDKNNQEVQLTKVAEIKLPTRPVNSQIKVLRMDDSQLSSMIFALHNNRVTFRTQKLGTFAISYGNKKLAEAETTTTSQAPSTIQVNKTKSVEKKDNLPSTGEAGSKFLVILGVALVGGGIFFLFKRRKDEQADDQD